MLTKNDLSQIQKVVNSAVQSETRKIVREETPKIIEQQTREIVQEETRKIVKEESRKIVREELVPIKEDISHIRKGIKTITSFFDSEYLNLRKRVERIEDHLKLSPISS